MAFVRAVGAEVMRTARDATLAGLVEPVLVGEESRIRADAEAAGWDLHGARIVNAEGEAAAADAAIAAVNEGTAGGLVKGHIHTDLFMGAILRKSAGLRTDRRLVHVFAMLPPGDGKPLLISDAAVNISPDVKTRIASALVMADLARRLGAAHPRIAVLSATESELPAMPSSLEAGQIAAEAARADARASFAGPLSLDLAISPAAAKIKGVDDASPLGAVAGFADGLVVPDIVSGNVLFKALAYCAGGLAAGLVAGARVPVILTSRADPPAARLASIALAAISEQGDAK